MCLYMCAQMIFVCVSVFDFVSAVFKQSGLLNVAAFCIANVSVLTACKSYPSLPLCCVVSVFNLLL